MNERERKDVILPRWLISLLNNMAISQVMIRSAPNDQVRQILIELITSRDKQEKKE